MGVIEFRPEVNTCGTVHQTDLGVAVITAVMLVEGRQNMPFVKGHIVNVRGHEVHERRHGHMIMADGACEYLTVHVEVVDVFELCRAV